MSQMKSSSVSMLYLKFSVIFFLDLMQNLLHTLQQSILFFYFYFAPSITQKQEFCFLIYFLSGWQGQPGARGEPGIPGEPVRFFFLLLVSCSDLRLS